MKIAIRVNLTRKHAYEVACAVINKLNSLGAEICMKQIMCNEFIDYDVTFLPGDDYASESDLIVSIGGDGTFIHSSHVAAKYDKPILGINAGNLGFLTGLEKTELDLLENLMNGQYTIDSRMMICCEIHRNNELKSKKYCLNDVVITRGSTLKMCDIDLIVDGRLSNSYTADGLIFSTPTGSTAYSLSAGGPVIDPTIDCIITTPICTHKIFNRSIIFRDDANIDVFVQNSEESDTLISLDGRNPIKIDKNDKILIRKGNRRVKVIRLKSDSFTQILQNKLTERRMD